MRAERVILAFFILFLSVGLCVGAAEEKLQKEKPGEKGRKSLIRKELLLQERGELGPTRRNIFSPWDSGKKEPGPTGPNRAGFQQNLQDIEAISSEMDSPLPLNIRYLGYILSGENTVALIIFAGNAQAVEEGDMISEGVRVEKITPEVIEIMGRDSKKRRYSLEGEEQ